MREIVVPLAIAFASVSGGASAAQAKTITYVHLATQSPLGRSSALYDFSFQSKSDDFQSALVFFNLNGGIRYGCGVHAGARCTLHIVGQTLTLTGLDNGVVGSFAWSQSPVFDNHPIEISIGVPLTPLALSQFESAITLVSAVPEPATWTLMIAGLGLLGAQCRRARRTPGQRSWLSLLPRRLIPPRTTAASRADWQGTQVRVPGRARRRASGIRSPQSSQYSVPSPAGMRARAPSTASFTVSSI